MSAEVRFGIIGCGLMGREFASVSMRWLHLTGDLPRPVIVAACDASLSGRSLRSKPVQKCEPSAVSTNV